MKKLNVKTIVFAAVLVAMNLVLSRVLVINIGSTLRITVSATPIYLASLWFGPLVGGICGGLGSAGMSDPGICTESIDSGVFCVGRCDSCSI